MKNTFFLFAIILLLAACSKDKKVTPPIITPLDVTGQWSLYSSDDTFFTTGIVTANQYPCITNNIITFKSDSTYSSQYTGTDICYITPTHGGNGSAAIGEPGQPVKTGTWRRNGNDIYIGTDHYVASKVNSSLVLNATGSFTLNGTTYTITSVFHKK